MFKLLVNKTRIHKVNDMCLGSVLFTQIRNSFKIKPQAYHPLFVWLTVLLDGFISDQISLSKGEALGF